MNLEIRYKGKLYKRIIRLVVFFSFLIAFVLYTNTFSRYASSGEADSNITVAKWEVDITTRDDGTITNELVLIPNNTKSASGKISPGEDGYFDVIINPNNTEVSVDYKIDFLNLPEGIKILSYEVLEDNTDQYIVYNNTVEGNIKLNDSRDALNSGDKKTLRFYWIYDDVNIDVASLTNETSNLTIGMAVTAKQKLSDSDNEELSYILDKLKIGDFVNYTPVPASSSGGNYTFLAKYSGWSSDQTISVDTDLGWRIFEIDTENGMIDLICNSDTSQKVYFGFDGRTGISNPTRYQLGIQAYNNGVYLLNEACRTLYSNADKRAVARSINVTDFEKHFVSSSLYNTYRYRYYETVDGERVYYDTDYYYGDTKTYTGFIPTQQINDKNDSSTDFDALGSESRSLIEPENAYEGSWSATQEIRLSHFQGIDKNSNYEDVENATKLTYDSIYRELLINNPTIGRAYLDWIASRTVDLDNTASNHERAVFHLLINNWGPNYCAMAHGGFYAWDRSNASYRIRPIVRISARYIDVDDETNNGSSLEKAYNVK